MNQRRASNYVLARVRFAVAMSVLKNFERQAVLL